MSHFIGFGNCKATLSTPVTAVTWLLNRSHLSFPRIRGKPGFNCIYMRGKKGFGNRITPPTALMAFTRQLLKLSQAICYELSG